MIRICLVNAVILVIFTLSMGNTVNAQQEYNGAALVTLTLESAQGVVTDPVATETQNVLRNLVANTASVELDRVVIEAWGVTAGANNTVISTVQLRIKFALFSDALALVPQGTAVQGTDLRVLLRGKTTDIGTILTAEGYSIDLYAGRPPACGDRILASGESCDDGNLDAGDGCSQVCSLETGYMCAGHVRNESSINELGVRFVQHANGSISVNTEQVEGCTLLDICTIGNLWRPENYAGLYAEGVILPPRGYYCGTTCKKFPVPAGYKFGDVCELENVNECAEGQAVCDFHALCEDKIQDATTLGYSCRCDPAYFVSAPQGLGCTESGVEVNVVVAGKLNFDEAETPLPDRAVMENVRAQFIDMLIAMQYVTNGVTREILLEAIIDYPVELIRVETQGVFAGRALWQVKVRASSLHVNFALVSGNALWDNSTLLASVFTDVSTPNHDAHILHTRAQCTNDRNRQCTTNSDCLSGGTCNTNAVDISVAVLSAGGSSSPVFAQSSGLQVLSVTYDSTQTAWTARVRYDNTAENIMDVLYVPHIDQPYSAIEYATFSPDEFPCLPTGVSVFQQRRKDNVCCLPIFNDDYTTVASFPAFLSENQQLQCSADGLPPSNYTDDILDTTQDFVEGPFHRMTRSSATLDPTVTSGYRDIILYLAEEDMRSMGGVRKEIDGGFNLRFFIGMAHIKGLKSTSLSVQFSQVEIVADVTQTYTFTTSAATDFTFVEDISVELVQVSRTADDGGGYAKFAEVALLVPRGLSDDLVAGLIPFGSARASTGFTVDTTSTPVYPCRDTFSGAQKTSILLAMQNRQSCAFKDPICSAIGPRAIGAGGQIYFIFPLEDSVWTDAQLDLNMPFEKYLFLDFMLSAVTAQGQRVQTRVQTRTLISRLSISSMCDKVSLSSAIEDVFEIDMYLGLVPTPSQFDASLVQARDITRTPGATHLVREVSSRASNVLTLLVKGSDDTFAQSYSKNYALEIEDMYTMHFLDINKKAQVEALIASGSAFTKKVITGSRSMMRLIPTDALLQICPIQATRGVYGCMTRRDIQERYLDIITRSIYEISPDEGSNSTAKFKGAGTWLQGLLGNSNFSYDLGYNHSQIMTNMFKLNNRYRRGFIVDPTIPWRQSDMLNEGVTSVLDLAQFSISTILLSLDQNLDRVYEPAAQLSLSSQLPLTSTDLGTNLAQQQAIQKAYADALGVSVENVALETGGLVRRRNLLQAANPTNAETRFKIHIDFARSTDAEAYTQADAALKEFKNPDSAVSKALVRALNALALSQVLAMPLLSATPVDVNNIPAATEVTICKDTSVWVYDIKSPETGAVVGNIQCASRRMVTPEGRTFSVGIRGPQTVDEWNIYNDMSAGLYDESTGVPRTKYNFAVDSKHAAAHWLWWDMCAERPAYAFITEAEWQRIRTQASTHCCECSLPRPRIAGTREVFRPALDSWPWNASTAPSAALIDLTRISLQNMQTSSYKGLVIKCIDGAITVAGDHCVSCPVDTYVSMDKLSCVKCPLNMISAVRTASKEGCVCASGYSSGPDQTCVPCARGFYRDALRLEASSSCLPCPAGMTSRVAATSKSMCVIESDNTYSSHPYEVLLGLISFAKPVQPEWVYPPAISQDNSRLCLYTDAAFVSCPQKDYNNVLPPGERWYKDQPTPGLMYFHGESIVRVLFRPDSFISLYQRPGYMGAAPPGFSAPIRVQESKTATIRTSLRILVPGHDLSARDQPDSRVWLVQFIARRKLDESVHSRDFEWIVCGRKSGEYSLCSDGPDPDNFLSANIKNKLVVDAQIKELSSADCCRSCYTEGGWMQDCSQQEVNPKARNMYDNAIVWTPQVSGTGDFWLYTYFVMGQSSACKRHNCDESRVYANIQEHLGEIIPTPELHRIDLLPGTDVLVEYHESTVKRALDIPAPSILLGGGDFIHYSMDIPAKGPMRFDILPTVTTPVLTQQYVAVFVTDTTFAPPKGSRDWEWIVCGRKVLAQHVHHSLLQSPAKLEYGVGFAGSSAVFEAWYSSTLLQASGGFIPPVPKRLPPTSIGTSAANGWARCNLVPGQLETKMPCAYTVGDIQARYKRNIGVEYNTITGNKVSTLCFTGETRTVTSEASLACAVPLGAPFDPDCICGIVFSAWRLLPDGSYAESIMRASEYQGSISYVSAISRAAAAAADVLEKSWQTPPPQNSVLDGTAVQIFGINPLDPKVGSFVKPKFEYDICQAQADPDNAGSVNNKNSLVLGGFVAQVGSVADCCRTPPCSGTCPGPAGAPYIINGADGRLLWEFNVPESSSLHVMFLGGDSSACLFYNCDEMVSITGRANDASMLQPSQVMLQISVTEGLSAVGQVQPGAMLRSVHPGAKLARKKIQYHTAKERVAKEAAASAPMRKLLTIGTSLDKDIVGTSSEQDAALAASREITNIDNMEQLANALCKREDGKKCPSVDLDLYITAEEYCLPEADLVLRKTPHLIDAFAALSDNRMKEIIITSVSRPDFFKNCAPNVPGAQTIRRRRNLLAVDETFASMWNVVATGNSAFKISPKIAGAYGIGYMQVRANPQEVVICRETTEICEMPIVLTPQSTLIPDVVKQDNSRDVGIITALSIVAGIAFFIIAIVLGYCCIYRPAPLHPEDASFLLNDPHSQIPYSRQMPSQYGMDNRYSRQQDTNAFSIDDNNGWRG